MYDANAVVCTDVHKASLELFTPEEIRKLSVCRVTCSSPFDADGPRKAGLHDPAMGPMETRQYCATCGCRNDCPGHIGHIELALPVFHPTLLRSLIKLLKMVCFRCKRLRVEPKVSAIYVKKFQLVQNDMLQYYNWFDMLNARGGKKSFKRSISSVSNETTSKKAAADNERNFSLDQVQLERRAELIRVFHKLQLKLEERKDHLTGESPDLCEDISETSATMETWINLRKEFIEKAYLQKICFHCSRTFYSSIREAQRSVGIDITWPWTSEKPFSFRTWQKMQDINENKIIEEEEDMQLDDNCKTYGKGGRVLGKYHLQAFQVVHILRQLWNSSDKELLEFLYPMSISMMPGGRGTIHPRTASLINILQANEKVIFALNIAKHPNPVESLSDPQFYKELTGVSLSNATEEEKVEIRKAVVQHHTSDGTCLIGYLASLQEQINAYVDKTKAEKPQLAPAGIRQWMERKEGAIRHKMMGKRVNFAARTVIAPDCYVATNEIGIPLEFAKQLTIPEYVSAHNVAYLRRLVENGPDNYPGANAIQDANGNTISLKVLFPASRRARARTLMTGHSKGSAPRIVYRHVRDGDVVLMNRQPTLHKPGIMAHFVKVLTGQKTFRLNYVNCNTYNADFDGDEMNLHVPQDPVARVEAQLIANADCQFTVPKSGEPLRGLIQDHCQGGAFLTCRDTFLTLDEYTTLVYVALSSFVNRSQPFTVEPPEKNFEGDNLNKVHKEHNIGYKASDPYARFLLNEDIPIHIERPAILKPLRMWTGKQVITCVLKTMLNTIARLQFGNHREFRGFKGINLKSKSKTPGDAWGGAVDGDKEESTIIIM